jgi:hypothetical protein
MKRKRKLKHPFYGNKWAYASGRKRPQIKHRKHK